MTIKSFHKVSPPKPPITKLKDLYPGDIYRFFGGDRLMMKLDGAASGNCESLGLVSFVILATGEVDSDDKEAEVIKIEKVTINYESN